MIQILSSQDHNPTNPYTLSWGWKHCPATCKYYMHTSCIIWQQQRMRRQTSHSNTILSAERWIRWVVSSKLSCLYPTIDPFLCINQWHKRIETHVSIVRSSNRISFLNPNRPACVRKVVQLPSISTFEFGFWHGWSILIHCICRGDIIEYQSTSFLSSVVERGIAVSCKLS